MILIKENKLDVIEDHIALTNVHRKQSDHLFIEYAIDFRETNMTQLLINYVQRIFPLMRVKLPPLEVSRTIMCGLQHHRSKDRESNHSNESIGERYRAGRGASEHWSG